MVGEKLTDGKPLGAPLLTTVGIELSEGFIEGMLEGIDVGGLQSMSPKHMRPSGQSFPVDPKCVSSVFRPHSNNGEHVTFAIS